MTDAARPAGITHASFAMHCALLAKEASAWAAGNLTLPEHLNADKSPDDVAKFLEHMRGHLDLIERMAGLAPPRAAPRAADAKRRAARPPQSTLGGES